MLGDARLSCRLGVGVYLGIPKYAWSCTTLGRFPPRASSHLEGTRERALTSSSDTMYLSITLRLSTPPRNLQLNILVRNGKQ